LGCAFSLSFFFFFFFKFQHYFIRALCYVNVIISTSQVKVLPTVGKFVQSVVMRCQVVSPGYKLKEQTIG